jgi:two-component system phosphate regulon response regulator PhoB
MSRLPFLIDRMTPAPSKPANATVLIVDDEPDLRALLDFNLRQAGYHTVQAATGAEALERAHRDSPDLVLLDINLPDVSGTEVCRRLKASAETAQIPIIMLTARGGEIDRVGGFELGADDYVVKPFSVRELILRLDVARRRRGTATPPRAPGAPMRCGPIELDPASFLVRVDGLEVQLALLEFRLLAFLLEAEGKVRTREELLGHVWGYPRDSDSRTIETHIKRLRQKLGPAGDLIETVRSVGYRLRPPG